MLDVIKLYAKTLLKQNVDKIYDECSFLTSRRVGWLVG